MVTLQSAITEPDRPMPLPISDLPALMRPANGPARRLVVLLHGYGGDGREMAGFARRMARRMPDAAFFTPDGPEPCPDGVAGLQWFATPGYQPGFVAGDPAAMPAVDAAGHARMATTSAAACPALDARIDAVLDRLGLEACHMALAGFSQGQMMSLALMLGRLRGGRPAPSAVVGFSGTLLGPVRVGSRQAESIQAGPVPPPPPPRPPVLLIHGQADDIVPIAAARYVQATLAAAGFPVDLLARPGLDHRVDLTGLAAATSFIDHHLPSADPAMVQSGD